MGKRLTLVRIVGTRPQFMQAAVLRRALTRRGHAEGSCLATIYRAENTNDLTRFASLLAGLVALPLPVIRPVHPCVRLGVERFAHDNDGLGALRLYDPYLLEFVPGAELLPQPVDIQRLDQLLSSQTVVMPSGRPGIDRPVRLAHAPSNRQLKGTSLIEAAVARLQQRGLNLELVMIEHKPHAEALALGATCDLAIDQLLVGAYGQFAVEMMALGKPTLCYIRADLQPLYPAPCPIVLASPDHVEEVLGAWATQPAWWREAGAAGRAYVERVHDKLVIAQRCLEAYSQAGKR